MKKVKGLTESLKSLERVISDPKLGSAHREALTRAKKELKRINRSGKLDHRDVFRVVDLICKSVESMVDDSADVDRFQLSLDQRAR